MILTKGSNASPEQESLATISVIIPAFENPDELVSCLRALAESSCLPAQVFVVDDGSRSGASEIESACREFGAHYLRQTTNGGPAEARNAGARAASGDVLVFLDADVAVHADTLEKIALRLGERPQLDAVFGAYDDSPAAPGTVSRFRNLLHHYFHLRSAGKACTFWAGCGAIRRSAFEATDGFPESYTDASIEDVEFGRSLHRLGFAVELDPSIQATHGKRWTLQQMFRTDLFLRAAPWAESAYEWGSLSQTLNFGWINRLCVMLTGIGLLALAVRLPLLALFLAACILALNIPFYRLIARKLGIGSIPVSAGAHLVHFCAAFLGLLLGSWRFFRRRDPYGTRVACWLFAIAALVQVGSGAYSADTSGHPDEPGHFVTSVMVSRYLDQPFQHPLKFASQFYLRYPKVAIGHWPPLGYILQGAWMRVTGVGRAQALLLVLISTVLAAFVVYELLWPELGRLAAAGAATLWLLHPTIQPSYQQVMMEMPVILFSLLALVVFREYLARPGTTTALGFGLLSALALLIKANAIVLAVVPVCYVLLAGRWDLPRRFHFWLAAVPPLCLAGPWYAFATLSFYQDFTGWAGGPGAPDAASYFGLWWKLSGWLLLLAAGAGLVVALRRRRPAELLWSAVLLSCLVTSAMVQAMGEARHLLLGLTAMIALALLALRHFPKPVLVSFAGILLVANWHWEATPHAGYANAAAFVAQGPVGNVLLSGPGDGAVIAAAAAAHPDIDGRRLWLRATKVMGNVAWSGRLRYATVGTPEEVRAMLARQGINQVLLEPPTRNPRTAPFHELLTGTLEGSPEWRLVGIPHSSGRTRLFRRSIPVAARPVSVYVPRLGAWIGETDSSR